jgi:hypothetical protein
MALAPFVATTRITIALKSVTDAIQVGDFDAGQCILQITAPPKDALAGTFADLHIEEFQMPGFRENLVILCPEIAAEVGSAPTFPLAADMPIQVAIDRLESLLLVAMAAVPPKWNGECLPADLPGDLMP